MPQHVLDNPIQQSSREIEKLTKESWKHIVTHTYS